MHRLGKACQIARRPLERWRRDEGAKTLATKKKAFVNERLNGPSDSEPTYREGFGELSLAGDPVARLQTGKFNPKMIDELPIKRPVGWARGRNACGHDG